MNVIIKTLIYSIKSIDLVWKESTCIATNLSVEEFDEECKKESFEWIDLSDKLSIYNQFNRLPKYLKMFKTVEDFILSIKNKDFNCIKRVSYYVLSNEGKDIPYDEEIGCTESLEIYKTFRSKYLNYSTFIYIDNMILHYDEYNESIITQYIGYKNLFSNDEPYKIGDIVKFVDFNGCIRRGTIIYNSTIDQLLYNRNLYIKLYTILSDDKEYENYQSEFIIEKIGHDLQFVKWYISKDHNLNKDYIEAIKNLEG